MADLDRRISDYTAALLLGYFRQSVKLGASDPRVDPQRDRDLLMMHWAISSAVFDFLEYIRAHPYEAESLFDLRRTTSDGFVRGRIDARATVLAQAMSGNTALTVSDEPTRSFETGPNSLVAWVVRAALRETGRFRDLHGEEAEIGYFSAVERLRRHVAKIRRMDPFNHLLHGRTSRRRPGTSIRREARRSRKTIYRLAGRAYDLYLGVEKGDPDAIRTILHDTLSGPFRPWRTFELGAALAIGEALSDATRAPLVIEHITPGVAGPVVRCGHFAIYWQSKTHLYVAPAEEPSEAKRRIALLAYGMDPGADRPDLVVVDDRIDQVAAVVEVKHSLGDSAATRFGEAVDQVVRYSRGYRSTPSGVDDLISRSLVLLSAGAPAQKVPALPAPAAADFDLIQQGALHPWVRHSLLGN